MVWLHETRCRQCNPTRQKGSGYARLGFERSECAVICMPFPEIWQYATALGILNIFVW